MFKQLRIPIFCLLLFGLLLPVLAVSADPISRDELQRLQQVNEILRSHIEEMEADLTPSPSLEKYEREFRASIPDVMPRPLNYGQWAEYLKNARVVIQGDDHATAESQRNTVKTLQLMTRGPRPVTLVIEWIDRGFQKEVDRYLQGDIPPVQFAKRIQYEKNWGFPWKNYLRVLDAAKKLKVPVLLVERLTEKPGLAKRDSFITADIKKYMKDRPNHRLLVVYGEYHTLGRNHLTDKLARAGIVADMVIIGDAEPAYWRLLQKTMDPERVDHALIQGRLFYQKSGTPLERRAGYRHYLMDLLGYSEDDFEEWVTDREIRPISHQGEKFRALELAPAR